MINFISTFPPILCGIGTYTEYLTSKMSKKSWGITSFRLDESLKTEKSFEPDERIAYTISLLNPRFPSPLDGEVLWFMHAFGMWGDESPSFLKLIKEAKERKKKTIVSLHTLHFQSTETSCGLRENEKRLLKNILPVIDALTVFTTKAYQAVIHTFPEYTDKVVVLRHGVHLQPHVDQKEARKKLLRYMMNRASNSPTQNEELRSLHDIAFSDKTIFLGNFGFITQDSDPLKIYKLRKMLQVRLPMHKVISIFIGRIQQRKVKKVSENLPILERLKSIHDGKVNFFFEDYILEEIFPFAFRALDFVLFWPNNATQSGRMGHAQGVGGFAVGRNIEGIGETLKLSGLSPTDTLEELVEKISMFVLNPELKEKARRSSWHYAQTLSFKMQAQKHLLLEETVRAERKLPTLDQYTKAL